MEALEAMSLPGATLLGAMATLLAGTPCTKRRPAFLASLPRERAHTHPGGKKGRDVVCVAFLAEWEESECLPSCKQRLSPNGPGWSFPVSFCLSTLSPMCIPLKIVIGFLLEDGCCQ